MDKCEIVERILVRLDFEGKIKDGKLLKQDVRTETCNFLSRYVITDFTYDDMPKAMLKYDFCYYMDRKSAHNSKHFIMKMSEVEKLREKYAKDLSSENSSETSNQENTQDSVGKYYFQHTLTTEQKKYDGFAYSDKSCFVCKETFDMQRKFEDHMKSHGKNFSIQSTDKRRRMLSMKVHYEPKVGKFVYKITSAKKQQIFTINRVILVFPEDNDFHSLHIFEEEKYTKFEVHCEVLSLVDHPYSILLFYTMGETEKISLLTQFHFTVKKLFHHEDITLDKIKDKNTSNRPVNVKVMKFHPLPWYDPSYEMKSLSKKKFADAKLSPKERQLLMKVRSFLNGRLTKENYVNFWETLVQIEDCCQAELMSKNNRLGEKLIFSQGYYVLEIPNLSELSPAIMEGDKLNIVPCETKTKKRKMFARVHQVRKDNIVLDVETSDALNTGSLYDVYFLPNRMPIQLERHALQYVQNHKLATFFFPDSIPTHPIDFSGFEWINDSVKENPEQQSAIIHMVEKSSFPAPYILMGPPGTGKTTTIVEAICQIIRREPGARILVSATSNYASNEVALRLLKYLPHEGIFRMFASSKETEIDFIDPELKNISNLRFDFHYYPHMEELACYNVVVTTLAVAGKFAQAKINCNHFSYVFIDECGSSTEPSSLIPIAGVVSSARRIHAQIILAGDPKQLGPIVHSKTARDALGVSILERLIDTGIYAKDPTTGKYNPRVITKLIRNFRSHPKILEFPDVEFYSGELMAEGSPQVTRWACGWKYLPNKSVPIIFEHVIGQSEQDDNSPSWYNMREVQRVMFHIDKIMQAKNICGRKIDQKSIGVITPYKKQCQKINLECKKRKWPDIDVGSVETFQGQERPVIILSTVRSLTHGVGFLNNPKRLNVALTRAQGLLIIVGNIDTLEKDPMWSNFIAFCRCNNVIKEVFNYDPKPKQRSKSHNRQQNRNSVHIDKENTIQPLMSVSVMPPDFLRLPDVPKSIPFQSASDNRNVRPSSVHLDSAGRHLPQRLARDFPVTNCLKVSAPVKPSIDRNLLLRHYPFDVPTSYAFVNNPNPQLTQLNAVPRPAPRVTVVSPPPVQEKKKSKCLIM
ncbi:putative helicase MOV-10 isoform X2 [Phlebotomus argentipes]|uniref:putative helicase MOV-10 isoform X2 n=1 Tax=Phlebotomus argentipes TaxID=94469 RepID=UPI002892AE1A|nr:putative helicase MOV-10 isoform X2 [Phlebotomus argentipes]